MRRRSALGLAAICMLVVAIGADAQQPVKVWHLGILSGEPPTESLPVVTPFLEELQKLGYAEGQNIALEWRWAEAREQKLPTLAAELVHGNVDLIAAMSAASVIAAKQVTTTRPIVMVINSDPVETGLVASYARPGGNVRSAGRQVDMVSAGPSGGSAAATTRERAHIAARAKTPDAHRAFGLQMPRASSTIAAPAITISEAVAAPVKKPAAQSSA